MCFSAAASFGAGAVLSIVGTLSLKRAEAGSEKAFASIPLIFAVQQTTEGFLWLALENPEYERFQIPLTYIFLFFAQVIWPFWVPFSVLLFDEKKKIIHKIIFGIGTAVSAYLLYCLMSFPVSAEIESYHIEYEQEYPNFLKGFGSILYLIATVAPPFFSRAKFMWLLGSTILLSYIMTTILYPDFIISVWCFFAAVISASVLLIVLKRNKTRDLHR